MRRNSLVLVLVLLAFVAMGCAPPVQELAPARTAEQVQTDSDRLRATWVEMANAGNAAGVAALYTEDAVYVDPYGGVHQGRAAIEGYFAQSFTRSSGYQTTSEGIVFDGDLGAGHGTWSATLAGPEGSMPSGGKWQSVTGYQPDGALKIRWHLSMIPAPMPAPGT